MMGMGTALGAWWRQRPDGHRCIDEALMQAIHTIVTITASKMCTQCDCPHYHPTYTVHRDILFPLPAACIRNPGTSTVFEHKNATMQPCQCSSLAILREHNELFQVPLVES